MVDRVVLDVELGDTELLGQPRGAHQRREAGVEAGLRLLDRQQFLVAPERRRPRLDQLAADDGADRGVVVRTPRAARGIRCRPTALRRVGLATRDDTSGRRRTSYGSPVRRNARGVSRRTVPQAPDARSASRTVTGTPARSYIVGSSRATPADVAARPATPSTDRRPTGRRRARRDRRSPAPRRAAAPAPRAPADASGRRPPRAAGRSRRSCSACTSDSTRCRLKIASVRGDRRRQRRPRLGRGQPDRRRRDDQLQVVGPGPAQHQRIAPLGLDHRRQAAEQRRRGVVGVPLDLGGGAEQHAVRPAGRSPARTARIPATVAAALLPSPAAIGMSLVDFDRAPSARARRCAARSRRTPVRPHCAP